MRRRIKQLSNLHKWNKNNNMYNRSTAIDFNIYSKANTTSPFNIYSKANTTSPIDILHSNVSIFGYRSNKHNLKFLLRLSNIDTALKDLYTICGVNVSLKTMAKYRRRKCKIK